MRRVAVQLSIVLLVISIVEGSYFVPTPIYPEIPIQIPSITNELCRRDSEILGNGLRNNTLWAFKMWDSSAKITNGLIPGNTYQLGHYDECLSVDEPIAAQYCLISIRINIPENITVADPYSVEYNPYETLHERIKNKKDPNQIRRDIIHAGLCIPSSCSPRDAQNTIQDYVDQIYTSNKNKFEITMEEEDCQTNQRDCVLNYADLAFCVTIVILLLTVTICTVMDFEYGKRRKDEIENSKSVKLLLCFSARENMNQLKKSDDANPALSILYGFRMMMMVGTVTGHSIINALTGPVFNIEGIEKVNRSWFVMIVCRGEVVVDTFFLFSGLLVTYSYMVQSEKKIVNPIRAIVLRYFRLIPALALVTFFYATVYYKLGSGPMWNRIVGTEMRNCQKNWWTNILLVNNYVDVEHLCILQSWCMPCDFQFFVMAVPLNILIKKYSKIGLSVLSILLLASIATPFFITYLGEKDPFYFIFNNYFLTLRSNDVFQSMYVPSHTRAAPYIIGMFLGYIYYKVKDRRLEISAWYSFYIGTLSNVVGVAAIFGGVVFFNPYRPYSIMEGSFYAAFHRPAFTFANGLLLLITSYGKIPWLKSMFSWQPLVPLGKLTFGAYLTHMAFQIARSGSAKTSQNITLYYWASNALLDVSFSMLASLVLFLLIENPIIRIMKELLPKDKLKIKENLQPTELFLRKI